jgi:hypothetical protein
VLGSLAVNLVKSAATSPLEASKKDRQKGPDDAEQGKAGQVKGPVQDHKDAHLRPLRPLAVSFVFWLIGLFSSFVSRNFQIGVFLSLRTLYFSKHAVPTIYLKAFIRVSL